LPRRDEGEREESVRKIGLVEQGSHELTFFSLRFCSYEQSGKKDGKVRIHYFALIGFLEREKS